ncbi:rpoE leader peptide RseD [Escherichia coli]|nr:rpoE leader peptide RseD [Escherichia coli]MDC7890046.1 rpoE leader peptide RseD [Escherichia coli]
MNESAWEEMTCLFAPSLMEWRFDSAWKFGLGRLYLG